MGWLCQALVGYRRRVNKAIERFEDCKVDGMSVVVDEGLLETKYDTRDYISF